MNDIASKLQKLRDSLIQMKQVLVAYSGGVDSTLLLAVANQTLGDKATAILAVSPSLPKSEFEDALGLAKKIGAQIETLHTTETDDPDYRANAPDRCFHCKTHVYGTLRALADQRGITHVIDGMNTDDTLDVRPGRAAARQHGILSPLHDCGFSKANVREASRLLQLPTWDKPAAACLASRVPYGTEVTPKVLQKIESAEAALRELGFRELRVRHHAAIARIEVPDDELQSALTLRKEIVQALREVGYLYVTLDLAGLRHGSLNETLAARNPALAQS